MVTLGRERAFPEHLAELARIRRGEAVLDVGCGTSALAIAAKQRVGLAGTVHGIHASPEMITRAEQKAAKAAAEVAFQVAVVEELPFPDASFDAVLSTLMLLRSPLDLVGSGPRAHRCARSRPPRFPSPIGTVDGRSGSGRNRCSSRAFDACRYSPHHVETWALSQISRAAQLAGACVHPSVSEIPE